MNTTRQNSTPRGARALLIEVQRRLPAGLQLAQEAYSSDHRRPVYVKVGELAADTFYFLDEKTARAFADAILEMAGTHPGGRLTVSFPFSGEFRSTQNRLARLAHKLEGIRVLAVEPQGAASKLPGGVTFHSIADGPLLKYRLAMKENAQPVMFASRLLPGGRTADNPRSIGFFTFSPELIEDFAGDIDQLLQGSGSQLRAFHQLELLHKTTQQVSRQLESYSRRIELAVHRAQRRPDLMTPQRFNRILRQAVAKMEELKEIPRRALQAMDKRKR